MCEYIPVILYIVFSNVSRVRMDVQVHCDSSEALLSYFGCLLSLNTQVSKGRFFSLSVFTGGIAMLLTWVAEGGKPVAC